MATLNLGRIKPVFQGAYNNSTAYVVDDIVTFGDETFICIQASTGNATSNASYWTKLAAKGTDGTDVGTTLTTQGDILYRDGSGLQRLAIGTANQILQVNSGANALEYTAKPEGKIVNMAYYTDTTEYNVASSNTYVAATAHNITYTPSATNNIIWIEFMPNVRQNSGGSDIAFQYELSRTVGGTATVLYTAGSQENYIYDSSGGQRFQWQRYFLHKDDGHNTTNQITYSYRFRNPHSNQQLTVSEEATQTRWRITEMKP